MDGRPVVAPGLGQADPPYPGASRPAVRKNDLQTTLQAAGIGGPDPFISILRQTTKKCEPRFLTAMCGCDLQTPLVLKAKIAGLLREPSKGLQRLGKLSVIRAGACMSVNCPDCHVDVSRRRGDRAKQRLDVGRNGGPVGQTVFTVPPRLRGRLADRHAFVALRREAWRILKGVAGARFGLACSHPVGDTDQDIFHPHVHFLWIGGPGFRGYLAPEQVDAMREEWSAVLGARVVDIHHSYTKGRDDGRLFHRCRYVCRSFPGFGAWCGSVAWFGAYPKGVTFRSYKTCRDCHQERRVIGTSNQAAYMAYKAGATPDIPRYLFYWLADLPNGPPRLR